MGLDIEFRMTLLERKICALEKARNCPSIEIVEYYSEIDLINKQCTRFVVVLVDDTNNNDMSLYLYLAPRTNILYPTGILKFVQTIAP